MSLTFYCGASIGHLLMGLLSAMIILKNNVLASFFVCNGVHLAVELLERNRNPFTHEEVENTLNHVGDVIFFFIGWVLGRMIEWEPEQYTKFVLTFIFVTVLMKEIAREATPKLFKAKSGLCCVLGGCWKED